MTTPSRSVVRSHPTPSAPSIPANLLPPSPPYVTPLASLLHNARYACQRASPLVCPNQSLVNALNVVRKSRDLEGDERSALSYARAIGVLKAYPNHVTSKSQVAKLPYLGSKLLGMIDEYVKTGQIAETESTLASPRFQTLTLFASVYGIGPTTARSLYARGLRTLEHLERFYGADEPPDTPVEPMVVEDDISGSGGAALVRTALGYRADLAIPIPWDEVEEIGRLVAHALEAVAPGCVSTIVGGYRRGKLESNDVDIVFTNPDRSLFRDHAAPKRKHDGGTEGEGLCKRVVRRLAERGMVTHVIHHATESFRDRGALKSVHWDTLEKALTVFVLPADSPIARRQMEAYGHPLRRRVDLICARAEAYWTAVVGWSGSTMFQRDLRLWAKVEKGLKFDSGGITRRRDSKPMYAKTEKEVFDLLGLEWIDPMWRNADA